MSLCRRRLATIPPSASLKQAMDRMTAKGVRQLPVVLQVEGARREGGVEGVQGGEEDKGGYSSSGSESSSSSSSDASLYVIGVLDREDVATNVR